MLNLCFDYGCNASGFTLLKLEKRKTEITCKGIRTSLLADLLQDLTGGLPGDALQSEQTDREPLTQQALQGATEVLKTK